jgi:alanyl-tRNA synthetase
MTPTERLYFTDPYLVRFTSRVVDRRVREGSPEVLLDRTAFYPEGGGQPADQGTLDGIKVIDVQAEAELVWHTLAGPLPADQVAGTVDWARRFDHMQQHHGQHLLSAAFEELFGLATVSFHLGPESSTIDLAGDASEDQLDQAEGRANAVIWEDRPVHARFVTPEELASLPLRKPPVVEGPVRVVSVPDFDHSACGGTHPRSTGAVGLLHVRRRERRGAETRVEFVCGGRALRDLRRKSGVLARIAATFSAGTDGLETAVDRLRGQEETTRKRLAAAMERLIGYDARELVAVAPRIGGIPLVQVVRDDLSLEEGRLLAREVATAGGLIALGIRGEKAQLVVARPAATAVDCGMIVRDVLTRFGGRGGGQGAIAQGGVPDPSRLGEAVAAAADLLRGVS